ncbi:MAG TPA: beta-galactosidase [Chloroflexota bacterium]|nr:beta-galactosidase [Chloroflexota bacterium]
MTRLVATSRTIALGIGATGLLALPLALDVRIARVAQPLTGAWRSIPVTRRRSTLLGISFRPPQVEAFGLEAQPVLQTLLEYPFQIIRLGAYWNRIEMAPGAFDPGELDRQIEAAEQSGKQIILCVGALKCFGYPEFFAPPHHLARSLPEHALIGLDSHPALLAAATEFIIRIVERYTSHSSIVAWQVENEAVDPLGIEHSWRLAAAFIAKEVEAVRRADPSRPILMNGFLPPTLPGQIAQWWQTRDQGDSLTVAQHLADIVGIDYYPRYAVAAFGPTAVYLDGTKRRWARRRVRKLLAATRGRQRLMISEGQAEPWEVTTIPPNLPATAMASCRPEEVITNYNACLDWFAADPSPYAYLFWGAEYWMLREQSGDSSYLQAFARILEQS